MALIDYLRPGYPKRSYDINSTRSTYAFRGLTSVLGPLRPGINSSFDGSTVERTALDPLENSTHCEITVETITAFPVSTVAVTDDQFPFLEIDYVQVEKNLRTHPAFIDFTITQWVQVDAWEAMDEDIQKLDFKYYNRDKDGKPGTTLNTLGGTTSTGQKAYALLRLKKVESFLDFAPVVRRTTKYRGNAAPTSADAGQKVSAPGYAPSGYEWIKTSDRVSKTGMRSNEWTRQEEWTGSRKILLDKDTLYI